MRKIDGIILDWLNKRNRIKRGLQRAGFATLPPYQKATPKIDGQCRNFGSIGGAKQSALLMFLAVSAIVITSIFNLRPVFADGVYTEARFKLGEYYHDLSTVYYEELEDYISFTSSDSVFDTALCQWDVPGGEGMYLCWWLQTDEYVTYEMTVDFQDFADGGYKQEQNGDPNANPAKWDKLHFTLERGTNVDLVWNAEQLYLEQGVVYAHRFEAGWADENGDALENQVLGVPPSPQGMQYFYWLADGIAWNDESPPGNQVTPINIALEFRCWPDGVNPDEDMDYDWGQSPCAEMSVHLTEHDPDDDDYYFSGFFPVDFETYINTGYSNIDARMIAFGGGPMNMQPYVKQYYDFDENIVIIDSCGSLGLNPTTWVPNLACKIKNAIADLFEPSSGSISGFSDMVEDMKTKLPFSIGVAGVETLSGFISAVGSREIAVPNWAFSIPLANYTMHLDFAVVADQVEIIRTILGAFAAAFLLWELVNFAMGGRHAD